jgi:hypothetical protein
MDLLFRFVSFPHPHPCFFSPRARAPRRISKHLAVSSRAIGEGCYGARHTPPVPSMASDWGDRLKPQIAERRRQPSRRALRWRHFRRALSPWGVCSRGAAHTHTHTPKYLPKWALSTKDLTGIEALVGARGRTASLLYPTQTEPPHTLSWRAMRKEAASAFRFRA